MSDIERKKLKLFAGSPELTGCGDELVLTLPCHRKNKLGRYERYDIELKLGRYAVQQLARQIATMHERDRERLAREAARIEKEISAIKQPVTT